MALTDKLTNIADAIREKTGGTDALTLDGMAAAIAAIEVGGGELVINGMKAVCGTFTVAEDVTSGYYNTERCSLSGSNLDKVYGAVYIIDGFPNNRETKHFIGGFATTYLSYSSYKYSGSVYICGNGNGANPSVVSQSNLVMQNFGQYYLNIFAGTGYPLVAGTTYGWIMIG